MSERKARTARKPVPKEIPNILGHDEGSIVTPMPAANPTSLNPAEGQTQQDPESLPGVLVFLRPMSDGQGRIEMVEINGMQSLSVPTLLRLAADIKENNLRGK